jgi:ABC-2 type transport system permease protein
VSWLAVARKDFGDAARSRTLWVVIGLLVLFVGGLGVLYGLFLEEFAETGGEGRQVTLGLILLLTGRPIGGIGPLQVIGPLVGLLLGYKSIAGERESGQLKLLLGLPHSRLDVVVGKFLGRSAVALVGLGAACLVAGLAVLVTFGRLAPGAFLGFVVVTGLFVVIHVAVGVGISALTPSTTVATVLMVAYVAVVQFAWGLLFTIGEFVLRSGSGDVPDAFYLLRESTPANAYDRLLPLVVESVAAFDRAREGAQGPLGGGLPEGAFYAQDSYGLVLLAFWLVVPLGIGLARFATTDL